MNVRALLERRSSITAEMRSLNETHPDGVLPADVQTRWDALRSESDSLQARIERQSVVDENERGVRGSPIDTGRGGFDALAAQVTASDVIRAQLGATDDGAGRAREVSAEIGRRSGRTANGLFFHMGASGTPVEQRVFGTSIPAGGPGSNTIQTTISPNLIDRLREKILVRKMGATILGGLTGNLSIPRLKASAVASWVAENSPITATDPQVDQVTFTPKHVGGIVELSRNMIMQPSLDVTRMVENDLTQLIAVALDQAAIQGGGANQPAGLLAATSGITIVSGGANGAAPTWANIIAAIGSVDASNALSGSLGFVTNAKAVKAMRQTLKTTVDTSSNFIMTDPNTLAGYALGSTQNVPSNLTKGSGNNLSALIFGDWSQLVLAFWSELDILVNPYASTSYAAGNVQVRCMATADIEIRHPLAFAAITDIIAP